MDLRERTASGRRHPWELARARSFRRLIGDHVGLSGVRSVLDIGAGDGWFAQELAGDLLAHARITCWDVNYRSEDIATPSGAAIERTSSPPDGRFDLVLALDVLEHIDDPDTFLDESVVPRLDARGTLIVSVPAHPRLYSDHDRTLGHHRRYRRKDLLELLGRHVDVRASGGLFTTLIPPRAFAVAAERLGLRRPQVGVGAWSGGPTITGALTAVLLADAAVGRRLAEANMALPGLSVWAVARPRLA